MPVHVDHGLIGSTDRFATALCPYVAIAIEGGVLAGDEPRVVASRQTMTLH
jgi:hypothetical protein